MPRTVQRLHAWFVGLIFSKTKKKRKTENDNATPEKKVEVTSPRCVVFFPLDMNCLYYESNLF